MNSPITSFDSKIPILLVGHGSSMNAIYDNEFNRTWIEIGEALFKPKAILCILVYWRTQEAFIVAMEQSKMVRNFYDFATTFHQI